MRIRVVLIAILAAAIAIGVAGSVREAIALSLVLIAPTVAFLAPDVSKRARVALGGGMVLAGLATAPGGNVLGLVMAATGVMLLVIGSGGGVHLDFTSSAMLFGYTVALVIGMYTALSADSGLGAAIALVVSLAVATSTWILALSYARRGQRHSSR